MPIHTYLLNKCKRKSWISCKRFRKKATGSIHNYHRRLQNSSKKAIEKCRGGRRRGV